ncbi:hypothetical protein GIB67_028932 [Kingdonia uniflora]|uniref:KIB1-4 beta-propeller domain-containing protein n=1 Tax=Kingdonia uniflora TaxID=39325 RepID=A0A7J7LBS9_9MAGN|nr:hypothetical protein GIB67_028932 [Kingdonia uniflora]
MTIFSQEIPNSFSNIGIARYGDTTWTCFKTSPQIYVHTICIWDQFYALNDKGALLVCDVNGLTPKAAEFSQPINLDFPVRVNEISYYLVEMSGELYLVVRPRYLMRSVDNLMLSFRIYKMIFCTRKWELSGSDDNAVFVGRNSYFSLLASDYPELKPNYIYFVDDFFGFYGKRGKVGSSKRMRRYSFEDGTH